MPLPTISHLQYLLLAALADGELTGRALRAALDAEGHKHSAPAFYQLMARMEEGNFVKGRYDQKVVEGQIIKERVYEVTGHGIQACRDVRDFYLAHEPKLAWEGA